MTSSDRAPVLRTPEPPTRPSIAQILASVLTAVTTTFALSYLGVAGTIIGAGLASTFTVLANYWYTRSILHTQRKVTFLAPKSIRTRLGTEDTAPLPLELATLRSEAASIGDLTAALTAPHGTATMTIPRPTSAPGSVPLPGAVPDTTAPAPVDPRSLMGPARSGRRRFIVPILMIFVAILGLVTAIDLILGKPLSDALRGTQGSGTTVFQSRASGPEQTQTGGIVDSDAGQVAVDPSDESHPADLPTDPPTADPSDQPSQEPEGEEPTENPVVPAPTDPAPTPSPAPSTPSTPDTPDTPGSSSTPPAVPDTPLAPGTDGSAGTSDPADPGTAPDTGSTGDLDAVDSAVIGEPASA